MSVLGAVKWLFMPKKMAMLNLVVAAIVLVRAYDRYKGQK
jgi:hypothetical protein